MLNISTEKRKYCLDHYQIQGKAIIGYVKDIGWRTMGVYDSESVAQTIFNYMVSCEKKGEFCDLCPC